MKDDNSKLLVKLIIFYVFRCSSDRKCPPESKNDVQLIETRAVHFARLFNNQSPEATNCFSIIKLMIIRENKIIDQFPTPKHQQIWLPF